MISIGTDIIEVSRIQGLIDKFGQRFLDRIFTPNEQEYAQKHLDAARRFAARFAAKEAVAKALGSGFRDEVEWTGIEVVSSPSGAPRIQLSKAIEEAFGPLEVQISLSHCKEYATATALITKRSKESLAGDA